jgi:hypothetical protein
VFKPQRWKLQELKLRYRRAGSAKLNKNVREFGWILEELLGDLDESEGDDFPSWWNPGSMWQLWGRDLCIGDELWERMVEADGEWEEEKRRREEVDAEHWDAVSPSEGEQAWVIVDGDV